MENEQTADDRIRRRDALKAIAIASAALNIAAVQSSSPLSARSQLMKITCIIRYQIDPFQKEAFRAYADNWGRIIPRCGGDLVGYFLPHEGTNDVAWGLIAFDSLAAYETYRARLKADPEAIANFNMAQTKHLILREERNFVEVVQGTLGVPSTFKAA